MTGTYSLIDKIISSFAGVVATASVALIGYKESLPQPSDPATPAVFWLTMGLVFILPVIGWLISVWAMKGCKLDREEMVRVQQRIAAKKAETEQSSETPSEALPEA